MEHYKAFICVAGFGIAFTILYVLTVISVQMVIKSYKEAKAAERKERG